MLKLSNIKKDYHVADTTVEALKGINLCFRKNEFVSILGPSGCGKTTMLNIIGGLDKYTSGDLFINGRSTKEYTDRDWDIYRNHRIGFIFQSYNLIPHQTILENVELALTISGVSKQERAERAKKALDRVGLAKQYKKKPNQLSGGQCQRVAIARALVNEPEILLADEPTGALDTETSIQIMELIKEIAKERLVIMVTHNPDLAYKYSTRIVRLLDGEVIEDSNPFDPVEEAIEAEKSNQEEQVLEAKPDVKKEKAKMSFWTSFKLSAKNLLSKRGRSLLVCFAGAIGIIGVSSVLSVSTGVKEYIVDMQDDLLSGNPISISRSGVDMASLMSEASLSDKRDILEAGDYVNVNQMIQYLIGNQDVLLNLQYQNEFNKDYVDYLMSMPKEYRNAITLNYGLDISKNLYTDFTVSTNPTHKGYELNKELMSLDAITETYTQAIKQMDEFGDYAQLVTSLTTMMSQAVPNNDYISTQYDIVYGTLPQNRNDIVVVLNGDGMLSDLLLVQLGYYTQDDFFRLVRKALDLEENKMSDDEYTSLSRFEYEEIAKKKFYFYPNDEIYEFTGTVNNPLTGTLNNYKYKYDGSTLDRSKAEELNVVGIVKPKEGISYGALQTGFLYTEDMARHMIDLNHDSKINEYIRSRNTFKDAAAAVNPKASYLKDMFAQNIDGTITYNLDFYWEFEDRSDVNRNVTIALNERSAQSEIMGYFGATNGNSGVSLRGLGGDYMPQSINVYPIDFESKDLVTDYLDKWNSEEDVVFNRYDNDFENIVEQNVLLKAGDPLRKEIRYMDNVEIIINMINQMINIVTYALIAFTALSLLVSCVMISIITYVSVMERKKEIGVIRSLGGRKRDVANLFNAETCIIGLSSGLIGIGVTAVISLIANVIVSVVSGGVVTTISHLTFPIVLIMILVSIVLTVISGLIPAASAAKKDPVEALRSE